LRTWGWCSLGYDAAVDVQFQSESLRKVWAQIEDSVRPDATHVGLLEAMLVHDAQCDTALILKQVEA
jgi:hypothetical protein